MTGTPLGRSLVLAIHLSARGFGWAVFENPLSHVAAGVFTPTRCKDDRCIQKIDRLLGRYQPETVILEAFDPKRSRQQVRKQDLGHRLVSLVRGRAHDLAILTHSEVQAAFADVGARTREEIADAIHRSVPALAYRLPKPRTPGDSERKALPMFSAAALVFTHYRNGATALLDDLRDAA
ncbi:hypothetical protein [Phenylobacterium sp.]|jgi:hypothetical protein|uniref:hypothetical protein n=1 Tax=Phenylobacterium sp. TaxID=1871053 RepID=UPI002E3656C2|nr:hypothetical protein [Phenylobacterium sp.]HEX3363963.1 hypothetical protein [Phenylobacterium sp.]